MNTTTDTPAATAPMNNPSTILRLIQEAGERVHSAEAVIAENRAAITREAGQLATLLSSLRRRFGVSRADLALQMAPAYTAAALARIEGGSEAVSSADIKAYTDGLDGIITQRARLFRA